MPLTLKVRHCHYVSKKFVLPAFGSSLQKYSRICSEQNVRKQPIQAPIKITQNANTVVPIFQKALEFSDNTALKDSLGSYTYSNLILGAKQIAKDIRNTLPEPNKNVAFLCPNNASSVVTLWGIWMTGHLAVPLSPTNPESVLEHFCTDSDAKLLITTSEHAEAMNKIAKKINRKLIVLDTNLQQDIAKKTPRVHSELECGYSLDFYSRENALILYSQDNQQKPRGVILSHKNLQSQTNSLVNTWRWTSNDTMLHVLPLNHFQGLISTLLGPMSAGAQCTMLSKFDATEIWSHLLAVKYNGELDHKITVFMATPVMYHKLVQEYEKLFAKNPRMVEYIKNVLKARLRLMLNAASPISESLYKRWTEITGHELIDTFGTPETGPCISTPLDDIGRNAATGFTGVPLDGISVRVSKTHERHNVLVEWFPGSHVPSLKASGAELSGELLVKGDQVFKGYLNRPEVETLERFTKDGWFATGNLVRYYKEKRAFQLVDAEDVIRTGDREVSALEIEHQLLAYPDIVDCAVVGIPDSSGGQRIGAVLVSKNGVEAVDAENVKVWARSKLPDWAVPSEVRIVDCLPKSHVGCVNKAGLVKSLFSTSATKK